MTLPTEFLNMIVLEFITLWLQENEKTLMKTYRLSRMSKLQDNTALLHYNNLYDKAIDLMNRATY